MEVEMADAGECDKEIFEKGEYVGTVTGGDAFVIEAFVKCVAEATGVQMDWHYFGGRGRVLAIGDIEKIRPEHGSMRTSRTGTTRWRTGTSCSPQRTTPGLKAGISRRY
jgi:hypothetical protein